MLARGGDDARLAPLWRARLTAPMLALSLPAADAADASQRICNLCIGSNPSDICEFVQNCRST